eukprot:2323860-Amphidinium_carterae.2
MAPLLPAKLAKARTEIVIHLPAPAKYSPNESVICGAEKEQRDVRTGRLVDRELGVCTKSTAVAGMVLPPAEPCVQLAEQQTRKDLRLTEHHCNRPVVPWRVVTASFVDWSDLGPTECAGYCTGRSNAVEILSEDRPEHWEEGLPGNEGQDVSVVRAGRHVRVKKAKVPCCSVEVVLPMSSPDTFHRCGVPNHSGGNISISRRISEGMTVS